MNFVQLAKGAALHCLAGAPAAVVIWGARLLVGRWAHGRLGGFGVSAGATEGHYQRYPWPGTEDDARLWFGGAGIAREKRRAIGAWSERRDALVRADATGMT